jgi:hypothetical protein
LATTVGDALQPGPREAGHSASPPVSPTGVGFQARFLRLNPEPPKEAIMNVKEQTAAIAALNDACRASPGPSWMLTPGVRALSEIKLAEALAAVTAFSNFSEDNDPHRERDFGAFEIGGARLFWKIDYYDLDLALASPDPADPAATRRVLTLMLAEEY